MGWKRPVVNAFLRGASRAGAWEAFRRFGPRRLTVLAYHRVLDLPAAGFDADRSNVSATPAAFREQMDHVRARFDVIDVDRLLAWLRGEGALPDRPLLITFDDGYRDNFEQAFPILREKRLPAVLFVTTGFVGSSRPFYWDRVAGAFERTRRASASVAGIGALAWGSERDRDRALRAVIGRLKRLPNEEKEHRVDALVDALDIEAAPGADSLSLSWDQVREMAANGISIGGHTHTHPILSRLPLDEARAEIATCIARLEAEVPRSVPVFAYTNGLEGDFGLEHERILAERGVRAAFTLLPGPASWAEVRARPLAIRRILVRRDDHRFRFEARLAGAARLTGDRL